MMREEILSLAWETAGNPEFWDEDDLVEFAERIAARAVEEYLDKASEEFEVTVQEMLSMHGKSIESGARDE